MRYKSLPLLCTFCGIFLCLQPAQAQDELLPFTRDDILDEAPESPGVTYPAEEQITEDFQSSEAHSKARVTVIDRRYQTAETITLQQSVPIELDNETRLQLANCLTQQRDDGRLPNHAALIMSDAHPGTFFWLIAHHPALSPFAHPRFTLLLENCEAEPAVKEAEANPAAENEPGKAEDPASETTEEDITE